MKSKGRLLPLLCMILTALALPTGASAATQTEVYPGRYLLSIELPESNGWQMSILAYGHREVFLRAQDGFTFVSYRAPGRVSSKRVEADFGALGQIDLKLDLEARGTGVPRLHGRCTGRSPYELSGRFHGTIDFPGEPNLVSIAAQKGKAAILRSFQHVCRPVKPKEKNPFGLEPSFFGARAHRDDRTTSIEAVGISTESELQLGIIGSKVFERIGDVGVTRSRAELVFPEELHISEPAAEPERVWMKPPRPFLGKASYLKAPGEPPQWTGDLRVRLPGAGLVSLAGPDFDATICRSSLDEIERCKSRFEALKDARRALLDLYGSGSHSQPLALARLSSLR